MQVAVGRLATVLAGPSIAAAQNVIEVRGADTKYRYADWNHTWAGAATVDVFYVGEPGSNEPNLGVRVESYARPPGGNTPGLRRDRQGGITTRYQGRVGPG